MKLFINEFINYYLKLGIDHIFIYSYNNDRIAKSSNIIAKSYKDFITIYDKKKDNIKNFSKIYNICYIKHKYNWLLMSNLNEYLVIKNDTLKNYLSNERFKDCNFIKILMIQPSYNNLSYYDKIPIFERFKDPNLKNAHFKTIFRNNIESLKYDIHSLSSSLIRYITCNNIGQKYTSLKDLKNNLQERNNDLAYIIDYKKSFEKYINKYKRIPIRIKKYFQDKEVSLENIENIDKELNLILYEYKKLYL